LRSPANHFPSPSYCTPTTIVDEDHVVFAYFQNCVNGLTLTLAIIVTASRLAAQAPTPIPVEIPNFGAAAEGYQSITDERFAPYRAELVQSARALEQALGGNSPFALDWKSYLKWDLLEPQLANDARVDRASLDNLGIVLRRFRSNHPGLELPVFTRVAAALDRYRDLAFWHALAARRDTAPIYSSFAKSLDEQLRRHSEEPTMETTRQIGTALGTIEFLGQAPEEVKVIRAAYSQPNIVADVTTAALNELAGPVCQIRPVRECILGATIRGTAITNGLVTFQPREARNLIELDMYLNGVINSRTVGYKKPVKIHATGFTNYWASKHLLISDDQFTTAGLTVDAQTRTRVHSVQKTGGKFGKRIIEKIAWKKVRESKPQSERIAARKAEVKIAHEFDDQVVTALTNGRVSYEEKLRAPLRRVALLTDAIRLASDREGIHSRLLLASHRQISTSTRPPQRSPENDVTVQVHETAVNNFLPTLLGGASLRQDSAHVKPKLEGDVPKWLRELASKTPKEAAEDQEPPHEQPAVDEPVSAEEAAEFRPWRFKFNTEAPASVSFADQTLVLRMRLAELVASAEEEESPRTNWDFIVKYKVIQDGNEVLLRRDGDIEAFPTGFDPRWDERLTSEQVGVRNNMARNLNKRAAEGQGFPAEIPLPAVKLPKEGDEKLTLVLTQLDCDNGWLTLGYRVP
jgi:hypothetical protein